MIMSMNQFLFNKITVFECVEALCSIQPDRVIYFKTMACPGPAKTHNEHL